MAKKKDDQDPYERAVDLLWDSSKYLLIFAGPQFAEAERVQPFASEFCTPCLVEKRNKFMGFWGEYFNRYVHDRKDGPEGGIAFEILAKWKNNFFDPYSQDQRNRKVVKKKGDEEPTDLIPLCFVVTANIDGWFGKAGFSEGQMWEMWGNIQTWQCSGLPDGEPCGTNTWKIDRDFRFHIDGPQQGDPRNEKKEAAPYKEMPDTRDVNVTPEGSLYDSEEEPDELRGEKKEGAGQGQEARKALVRRLRRATVIRVTPDLQTRPERYPDHFSGYPRQSGERPQMYLGLKQEQAAGGEDDAAAPLVGPAGEKAGDGPATPYLPLQPLSHLLQHVKALNRDEYSYQMGEFLFLDVPLLQKPTPALGEPVRDDKRLHPWPPWLVERRGLAKKNFATSEMRFFNHVGPETDKKFKERLRYVTYNLSVQIVDDQLEEGGGSSSDDDDDPALALSPTARGSGLAAARAHAADDPRAGGTNPEWLQRGHDPTWFQGKGSRYYFSHVPACDCYQSPPQTGIRGGEKLFHDVVQVPVEPLQESQLPRYGRCSTVVEMVVAPNPLDEKAKKKPAGGAPGDDDGGGQPTMVEHPYRRVVWQMVGRLSVPPRQEAARAREHHRDDDHARGHGHGRGAPPPPPDSAAEEGIVEYVLESRARRGGHAFKIGVERGKNRDPRLRYFEWEVPCEEDDPKSAPCDAATVRRVSPKASTKETAKAVHSFGAKALMQRAGQGAGMKPEKNHQLCGYCHGVARPRVRMVPRDNPRGVDKTLVPIKGGPFQDWQKKMLKDISGGGGSGGDAKGLCIMDLGAIKKMDPVRREAEKLWKKSKSNPKNSYIRICEQDIEGKKGQGDNENYLVLPPGGVIEALKRMEKYVQMKLHGNKK